MSHSRTKNYTVHSSRTSGIGTVKRSVARQEHSASTSAPGIAPNTMAALGSPIPAFTEHAISVSLPKWADNVGYEEGEARVVDAMQTGYPRFFIHPNIKKVR
jgi:hypothetical protein